MPPTHISWDLNLKQGSWDSHLLLHSEDPWGGNSATLTQSYLSTASNLVCILPSFIVAASRLSEAARLTSSPVGLSDTEESQIDDLPSTPHLQFGACYYKSTGSDEPFGLVQACPGEEAEAWQRRRPVLKQPAGWESSANDRQIRESPRACPSPVTHVYCP